MNLGAGQGEGREFATAPIVFAEGAHTNGVSGSQLVTPTPLPKEVSIPAPVVVTAVPKSWSLRNR
jgi:hypothetical protein